MSVQQAYLQPHEGVTGQDRPDDPVLTMSAGGKRILIGTVYQLYRGTLFGSRPPVVTEMHDRLTHPRPGDYVIVQDAAGARYEDTLYKGAGVFLGDREEWWTTDEQWEKDKAEGDLPDSDRMVDHAWYVQYGPDAVDVCRWVNCSLLAVPDHPLKGWTS